MQEGPKIPLQQTKMWEKLQHDLNQTTFFISENDQHISRQKQNQKSLNFSEKNSKDISSTPVNYQMLIIKKSTPVGSYFYLPYGPYLRQKSAAKPAYEALRALAQQEDVVFTRIEPKTPKIASYWLEHAKKSKDLSPKETWVLDLNPSMEELYKNMKQNTRNLSKNYAKKGIKIEKYVANSTFLPKTTTIKTSVDQSGEKIKILASFLKKVAKDRHFSPIEQKTLLAEFSQPFASLFIAYHTPPEGGPKIPIAASLFFDDDETRYYMQSGSDENYRKLPGTIAILAEAIKDAKEKNLKAFDFWGVAPENATKNHPWAGFTQFKKSFGGEEITYAGTYDLVRKPSKYQLYKILRKLNRLFRKIK